MDQSNPIIIKKVGLAVFRDKKVMMVRSEENSEVFYTLGGTVEEGETDKDCLRREIKEEAGCEVDEPTLCFLEEFVDVAHGRENTMVNISLYVGDLLGEPGPSSEIVEVKYFDSSVDHKHLSPISINQIFPWLKRNGYIG